MKRSLLNNGGLQEAARRSGETQHFRSHAILENLS